MPLPRSTRPALARSALIGALLLAGAACERAGRTLPADSASVPPVSAGAPVATARDRSGWNALAGPALLVQGAAPDEAIVLFPFEDDTLDEQHLDSASAAGSPVTMLGRGGARLSGRLAALPDDSQAECERWLLQDVKPGGGGAAWSVGFVDAHVVAVPLDSVDVLSPRDSAALAAEAARLASVVTAPTGSAFQGLRFAAHEIRRFTAAPGVQAFAAQLSRQVNQEANPQEEQTLLIAERDSGMTTGPYKLAYAERSFGREEQVVTPEVIAAVRVGESPQPTLIVARDADAGLVYALVERTGSQRWRARWTSSPSRCE